MKKISNKETNITPAFLRVAEVKIWGQGSWRAVLDMDTKMVAVSRIAEIVPFKNRDKKPGEDWIDRIEDKDVRQCDGTLVLYDKGGNETCPTFREGYIDEPYEQVEHKLMNMGLSL